jgi:transposase-like protein
MANPIDDLHAVFAMCGIPDAATQTLIMNREGSNQLDNLGVLETDTDVMEMAKRMASRTQAEGWVLLGTVVIKRLQTLVWWIRDHQKRELPLNANKFTVETMASAAEMQTLRRKMKGSEPSVKDLGKFDPDDFDAHEDAFLNLLAQSYGVLKEPLRYIVCSATVPDVFSSNEEQRMYQFPLEGGSFELDNQAVYRKLKAFLISSPGWAWIEPHDSAENGRNAYLAWVEHYNGEGDLSKRMAIAKSRLDTVHYRNERSMSFERCTEIMTKCFNTLHKDPNQRYSNCQKVEKLLKAIRCTDPELLAAKAIIDQNFPCNFIGACGCFSQQVARIHGPAQLEYWQSRHRKRGISAVDTRPTRGGRGRGRFGNRSGGRGNGRGDHRRGRGGHSYGNHVINGIDVSDPNRSFTAQEWEALGPNGG